MIKDYYQLTKPGIIRGNLITALAGYLIAVGNDFSLSTTTFLLIGLALVIGSACTFNNVMDRNIDKKMKRTKDRAVAAGRISPANANVFGAIIGSVGLGLLLICSILSALLALLAAFLYVVVYGYAKRSTKFATSIGAVPGALPPVIGYLADGRSIDIVAIGLFSILVVWQMPHFYAISLFRSAEYKKGGIKVVAHHLTSNAMRQRISAYIMLFAVLVAWFGTIIEASIGYYLIVGISSLLWIRTSISSKNIDNYGRSVFGMSLLVLLTFCAIVSVDSVI